MRRCSSAAPHLVEVVPGCEDASQHSASNLQQRNRAQCLRVEAFLRHYEEILRLDFAITVDLVGQSGRHPHPPTPRRRPDHKSLQAEATTCRTPAGWTVRGFFLWRSRRFSPAERILLECVSRQPHCPNAGRKWPEPPTSLSAIILDAPVSTIRSSVAHAKYDYFSDTKLGREAKARATT
jgi:hypothetical protein